MDLLPLPFERARDGARSAVGRVIDGGEQVRVGVLDVDAPRTQADFDLAARVGAARVAVGLREPDDHAPDSISEATQGEPEAILHVGAQDVA